MDQLMEQSGRPSVRGRMEIREEEEVRREEKEEGRGRKSKKGSKQQVVGDKARERECVRASEKDETRVNRVQHSAVQCSAPTEEWANGATDGPWAWSRPVCSASPVQSCPGQSRVSEAACWLHRTGLHGKTRTRKAKATPRSAAQGDGRCFIRTGSSIPANTR